MIERCRASCAASDPQLRPRSRSQPRHGIQGRRVRDPSSGDHRGDCHDRNDRNQQHRQRVLDEGWAPACPNSVLRFGPMVRHWVPLAFRDLAAPSAPTPVCTSPASRDRFIPTIHLLTSAAHSAAQCGGPVWWPWRSPPSPTRRVLSLLSPEGESGPRPQSAASRVAGHVHDEKARQPERRTAKAHPCPKGCTVLVPPGLRRRPGRASPCLSQGVPHLRRLCRSAAPPPSLVLPAPIRARPTPAHATAESAPQESLVEVVGED